MPQSTVADIGELELLRRLQPFCATTVIGDDAAVVPPSHAATVITTDVLVDEVHFSDRTTAPEDIGWRAIAANLSDLAAMAATPIGVTIGLSLTGTTSVEWVERVYRGMAACLQQYGGEILGGDIVRSGQTTLAVTALGQVHPRRVLRRDRAQPGQVIVATGWHGASRAGLELLLHPDQGTSLREVDRAAFIQAHQRPVPRLDVVGRLEALEDDEFQSISGMDSSDGLVNAVLWMCQAGGVGAKLIRSALPIPPALVDWVGKDTALEWSLYGGEDFELVICLPAETALEILPYLGPNAAIIGSVEAAPTVLLVESATAASGVELSWDNCFQHF
jgi:thiamine-monophosphate kinase